MQTKTCTKCNVEKALTEFYKDKDGKYGVKSRCKECIRELGREMYRRPEVQERKREYQRGYQREYQLSPEMREKKREYMSEYLKNPYVLDRKRRREREDARLRKEMGLVSNRRIEVARKKAIRNSEPWSDTEVKFLMSSDLPLVDIALELGRTWQSVQVKRSRIRKKLEAQQ